MDYRLENVDALWPKIDKPYKFDAAQNRSVPADVTDPDARYELHIVVSQEKATELAKKMREAFNGSDKTKDKTWAVSSLADIPGFKEDEGVWRVKLQKKTYADATSKPRQFMQDGTPAAADFQLTTGSKIHVMIRIAPWAYAGKTGVTLRPEGVMVVELAERKDPPAESMFGDLTPGGNPFADVVSATPTASAAPAQPKAEDVNPFGLPQDKPSTAAGIPDDEIPF